MFSIKTLQSACVLVLLLNVTLFAQSASLIKKIVPDFSVSRIEEPPRKPAKKNTRYSGTISSIKVEGNTSNTDKELVEQMLLSEGKELNDLIVDRARARLKRLGIFKDIKFNYNKKAQVLTVKLVEYPKITAVVVTGNSVYNQEFLDLHFKSQVGKPVHMGHVRADIEFLKNQYKQDGYFEAKIINIQRPEKKDGPLVFHIAEGVIDDIEITGNIKTKDYVILRELELRPGDLLNEKELRRNMRKVFNLNYFDDITPDVFPSDEANKHVLNLNLKEKESTGAFTFGGGFQPNTGFNVFSDLYWDNLMGTGKLIMLKGNFGLGSGSYDNQSNSYQFKYRDPWAYGDNRSLTFRLWSNSGNFRSFSLLSGDYGFKETQRKGIDVEIGVPHTYDFRSSHRVKYESVDIIDDAVKYYLYTYVLTLSHDKRDQRLNPREGVYNVLSIEQGFKFRPTAVDLTRVDLTLRHFLPTFKKQTIYTKLQGGWLRSPDVHNQAMFIDEYYYVGGSRTVRGYDDRDPFAYGRAQVLATLEYRFIFTTNITGYFFADAGYASKFRQEVDGGDDVFVDKKIEDLSEYKLTKGIGVTFVIQPLGPIRLDYGVLETGEGRVQFNMGYSF